jgi:hypothetical protein
MLKFRGALGHLKRRDQPRRDLLHLGKDRVEAARRIDAGITSLKKSAVQDDRKRRFM